MSTKQIKFELAKRTFSLPESFLDKYKDRQPSWDGLGHFVYTRTYSRIDPDTGKSEEFWQTCKRVVEGTFSIQKNHCKQLHLPWNESKAQRSAKRMFELMFEFKFLPPGRGLWAMGTDHLLYHGSGALQNCSYINLKNFGVYGGAGFATLMEQSMCGIGCGFSAENTGFIVGMPGAHLEDPTIVNLYQIQDDRESWADSIKELIDSYFLPNKFKVEFDYSKIRPAGSPIKGFGGYASGPEALRILHTDIRNLLDSRIGQELRSVDVVDICNYIGKCVIAGSTRRTAELSLGSADDIDFITMKQDKEKLIYSRWASNNSVIAKRGMDYSKTVPHTVLNGEPGYVYLDNIKKYSRLIDPPDWKDINSDGVNPCAEQNLEGGLGDGGELCCLCETFPANHSSLEEYKETLKYAYLYAKTVTLLPTAWPAVNNIILKNRRIGLSQSGIIQAFEKHGRSEMLRWCDEGYKYVEALDTTYSNWLAIPRSIKRTTVKPSGSVSLLAGATPGIHYAHSEYYIRRVRVGIHSPYIKALKKAGYKLEPAIGQEDSTLVVEFPVKQENFKRSKSDVSVWEQVSNAAAYQKYWSDNCVSITVTFKKEESQDIPHILQIFEDQLKTVSFLPISDHGYEQAPYETITKEKYEEMVSKVKPINFNLSVDGEGTKFCDGDSCTL